MFHGSDREPLNSRVPPQVSRGMDLHLTLGPIVALIAGILILAMPRLLNYIIALYLIAIGILGLLAHVKM